MSASNRVIRNICAPIGYGVGLQWLYENRFDCLKTKDDIVHVVSLYERESSCSVLYQQSLSVFLKKAESLGFAAEAQALYTDKQSVHTAQPTRKPARDYAATILNWCHTPGRWISHLTHAMFPKHVH